MKKILYSIILLLLVVPFVYSVSYDDKNTLSSIVSISNSFTIIPTTNSYSIKFVNASIVSYPRSDVRQIVTELTTEPKASIDDAISFLYINPILDAYNIRVDAKVVTNNRMDEIKTPISFPLNNLDGSLYSYLEPTNIIDVTPEIKNLASELIGDRTDLYEIEYVFAEYVRKNVAYDLGTLTSDVNQKSSWVLANKIGVCDEITNLFISLNRAAGIPARFVSGVSYTNLNEVFGKNWVSHAWAEVYYPGYGWIPYDVTYGQYGFIDAGHIKLMDSAESSSSNVNYNYLGNNIKLQPGKMDIDVKVLNYGEDARARYNFIAKAYDDEMGFGSYDMITVELENTQNYYQIADLYLGETQGVSIIEESKETVLNKTIHRKQVLMKPRQSATIYWIIKVDDNLDKNYIYTLPITVYNTYNENSTTFVTSRKNYKSIDYDYFKNFISSRTEELLKAYSKYIYLECVPDKSNMYIEDVLNIDCVLDNRGDKTFDKVNICIDNNCTSRSLAIQKIPLHYIKKFESEGLKNVEIKVYNDELTKVSYIPINVLDKPKASITDLKYPEVVGYGDSFDITFTLVKDSKSTPKNLKITLKSETNKVEWTFPDFDVDKGFAIKSNGNTMKPNKNNYNILVEYSDETGANYTTEKDFTIQSQATALENFLLYINLIGRSIEQVFVG
jgi:transglutaminase-like putative cysteine protease